MRLLAGRHRRVHDGRSLSDAPDLSEEQRNLLREAGTALPIVIIDGGRDSWRGFRPDKTAELA
ncbi:hypothetical protein GCM10010921_30490 [Microbacterium album]|uniref:NrdH-redoxin n=1 Tax=Microbacterium album TaxID=2053191 RepID=A0A917MNG7_9MICO|nr:hypothetical protein GCM10010921_30490 [Microbacterium album]